MENRNTLAKGRSHGGVKGVWTPFETEICMEKRSDRSQKSKMYEKKIQPPAPRSKTHLRKISGYAPA